MLDITFTVGDNTPSIKPLQFNMLAPYQGRVFDPCCGSAVSFRPLIMNAVFV